MREMVGGCCVCSDDRGWSENPLVYCDGQSCTVAVHQACYGIVTVPTGPWYCCKCESQERTVKVKCELCPSKYGALKRTDNQGWAHVVCALYIPEVRFGNVSTMEPIQLQLIPQERFNKVCYICEEKGKAASSKFGACMQCNKVGCKQQFHVTCAQSLGLLCEEAGNYLDNVKYCGYCQHHYSKLFQKKGGNVKTIPPYKPISDSHNSDSNSERESEGGASGSKRGSSPSSFRRKSGSSGKSSSSKVPNSSSKSSGSSSQQKTTHNNTKGSSDKKVSTSKVVKADDTSLPPASTSSDPKSDKKENKSEPTSESDRESKDKDYSKHYKKRKVNSRTPTPVQGETSVVVSAVATVAPSFSVQTTTSAPTTVQTDKSNSVSSSDVPPVDKTKKAKFDSTQSIISNQPVVALTSLPSLKSSSTSTSTTGEPTAIPPETSSSSISTPSIIHTAQAQAQQHQQQSLVVSVPLASTTLSPHNPLISNQTSVLVQTPFVVTSEKPASASGSGSERGTPVTPVATDTMIITAGSTNQGVLTSEMSGGGLKITYEKQPDSINTEVDMELEVETPPSTQDAPSKRGRSQSHEKSDRTTRGKKRNSTGSNGMAQMQTSSFTSDVPKRTTRMHSSTSASTSPQQQLGAFAVISQEKIKDSPPSSPSSESQGASSSGQSRSRTKGRKSAPAAVNLGQAPSKAENKEFKIFQNGVGTAPHMLGNQLNPTSTMHQKMTDHLNSELEAHSIYSTSNDTSPTLIGPQMHHKVVQSARASSTGSSTASGGSGLSSVLGGAGGTIPQTLDQLLERQWEQGSQFLMEQAQHFDIASLLSCLHQLRAENFRLEEHVSSLIQRRDHLLAVNARLAIPLTGQPSIAQTQQTSHSHNVNNIHPNVVVNHGDIPRPSRHSSGSSYDRHMSNAHHPPIENGLPPDSYAPNPHRSPVGSGQPSPTVRHPAGPYPPSNNGLLRQCADTGGRAAPPRPQPFYPLYDRPGSAHSSSSSSQQQV
ncbi:protein AF-10 isoform X3 [Sitophilus oryzae]|uniref:Protein AF-10 isoform X3 n=1 Tax=Sitophilus oryzae TaxID=7048 RepID=A0A6J2XAX9_SITOR|nr:protein AF-10 isoform X3 [Sitophilus oryzae]